VRVGVRKGREVDGLGWGGGGWVRVVKGDSPAAADKKRVRGATDNGARVAGRRGVWQAEQY
jgi:hypothetical protein